MKSNIQIFRTFTECDEYYVLDEDEIFSEYFCFVLFSLVVSTPVITCNRKEVILNVHLKETIYTHTHTNTFPIVNFIHLFSNWHIEYKAEIYILLHLVHPMISLNILFRVPSIHVIEWTCTNVVFFADPPPPQLFQHFNFNQLLK